MPTLDWLNRAHAFTTAAQVPYRLLEPVSVHRAASVSPPLPLGEGGGEGSHVPVPDNLLIQGDNLEALKALLPFYRGQVKCIFIDPPYNTQSAFEHYDDNLEHSQWLSMMLPRLQLLRELLREDGSIWVTIDDNEGHYLKVLMDEVFGRRNFVANVVWQKRTSPDARIHLGAAHDHVLVYAKHRREAAFNLLQLSPAQASNYKNPDNDPRGPWTSTDFTAQGWRPNQMYEIVTPGGTRYAPPEGRCWANIESGFVRLNSEGRIWFGKDGNARPRIKNYLFESTGVSSWSWWGNEDAGHNQESKKEVNEIFGAINAFDTPKPERLIQRVLQLATQPGDLVLDSFLGSGTTAAVAHKMGRRWIGIEMGEHAATHCLPRLQKVLDGEQGGISAAVNWAGGGGFRFLRLGAPIFDADGRIHPEVRFTTLAAFIWQQETGTARAPGQGAEGTPWLGTHYEIESTPAPSDAGNDQISPEISPRDLFSAPSASVTEGIPAPEPTPQAPRPVKALYLLFNGILGDKRPASGNVLTAAVLDALLARHATTPAPEAPLIVYGEACRLGAARLALANVTFRHIPYDVKAR